MNSMQLRVPVGCLLLWSSKSELRLSAEQVICMVSFGYGLRRDFLLQNVGLWNSFFNAVAVQSWATRLHSGDVGRKHPFLCLGSESPLDLFFFSWVWNQKSIAVILNLKKIIKFCSSLCPGMKDKLNEKHLPKGIQSHFWVVIRVILLCSLGMSRFCVSYSWFLNNLCTNSNDQFLVLCLQNSCW